MAQALASVSINSRTPFTFSFSRSERTQLLSRLSERVQSVISSIPNLDSQYDPSYAAYDVRTQLALGEDVRRCTGCSDMLLPTSPRSDVDRKRTIYDGKVCKDGGSLDTLKGKLKLCVCTGSKRSLKKPTTKWYIKVSCSVCSSLFHLQFLECLMCLIS